MNIEREYHAKFEFYHHLLDRGVKQQTQCWIDWNSERVWFPFWTVSGRLIGYQRYTWREPKIRSNAGRYFTWITEEYKPCAFWGMSQLSLLARPCPSQRILVCEGIFDALRCLEAGYPAIAVLTATPSKQFTSWFKLLTMNIETVGILDNDENDAGKGVDKLCTRSIMCELYKDMGEHSTEEAGRWLEANL